MIYLIVCFSLIGVFLPTLGNMPIGGGVEIVCSAGNEGRCFSEDCEMDWTPFGPYRHTVCVWSGWQRDFCVAGAPC